MARGTKRPSEVFKAVLKEAQREILTASRKAASFGHKGIRGDERAGALANFFSERLSTAFGVSKGEAIDFHDHRSSQLDLIVYHKHSCAPVSVQRENLIVPCEGLYCVIEVKTILNQTELVKAYRAAAKLRDLHPFKGRFVSSRNEGKAAAEREYRCMFVIFAYTSNAGVKDWLSKEYERIKKAADKVGCDVDLIDRVFVLNRGMIKPGQPAGKKITGRDDFMFVDFYLSIVNFIDRELRRRPPIDWQIYSSRSSPGWVPLAK